jgi:UrcA family protein
MSILLKSALRLALGAGALGLAALSAAAQSYDAGPSPYSTGADYSTDADEIVTVVALRFRADSTPLNGPLEKISLSESARYTFQDLVDPMKAHVLRWRIWRKAHEVCDKLADAYPVYPLTTAPSCYRQAYNDAMVKIDARITGARHAYWYGE